MKEKLIEKGKIAIVMIILFAMAYCKAFPNYWRLASAIWFLTFLLSVLDEMYQYLKVGRNN